MTLNINNINDLRESFNHIVKRNDEVQNDVKMAVRSEDYLRAVKAIDNYLRVVAHFIDRVLKLAENYKDKANYENENICLIAEKMAKRIKIAHLDVEKNILKKYIRKKQ